MDNNKLPPRMLPLAEAATEVFLPVYTLRRFCQQQKISYIKSGTKVYVNMGSLYTFFANGEHGENTTI